MAHTILAFLLASATAATLGCRLCRNFPSQRLRGSCFAEHSARALCAPRNDERLEIHHHVIALDRYGDGLGDIRSLHHGSTGLDIDRIGAGAEALRVAIGLAGADVEFPAVPGAADD